MKKYRVRIIFLLFIFYTALFTTECKEDGENCKNYTDCNSNFCENDVGDCNGEGTCQTKPDLEDCTDTGNPVCGCDGNTYSSECAAHANGVNVAREVACEETCTDNSDCPSEYYCEKTAGDCDGEGTCQIKPDEGDCRNIGGLVCGCDGNTYESECEAQIAGVNVASDGACEGTETCTVNYDCYAGQYCTKDTGDCDGEGTCQTKPDLEDCTDTGNPVCGCDGNTYSSECAAHANGVNVLHEGACEGEETCTDNSECSSGDYCGKDVGDCDGEGTCVKKPDSCIPGEALVCGCDGKTYLSECAAHANGVNVASEGVCETCTDNDDCPEGLYDYNCEKAVGDCEGEGTCVKSPDSCEPGEDPVCGCQGETYGNECLAHQDGDNVFRKGTCETCTDNSDCPPDFFCDKDTGNCNGEGLGCAEKPEPEDCTETGSPVCGCDGNTYDSYCLAQASGVNVASEGACEGEETCTDNSDCSSGYYCEKAVGDCDGEGTCQTKPDSGDCTETGSPVCGCDGNTYNSECLAQAAGVNVASEGACETM